MPACLAGPIPMTSIEPDETTPTPTARAAWCISTSRRSRTSADSILLSRSSVSPAASSDALSRVSGWGRITAPATRGSSPGSAPCFVYARYKAMAFVVKLALKVPGREDAVGGYLVHVAILAQQEGSHYGSSRLYLTLSEPTSSCGPMRSLAS